MNTKKIALVSLSLLLLPVLALAINNPVPTNPTGASFDLNGLITAVLNKLWVIFGAVAVIMFVYAGILFMTAQGAPDKIATARQFFLWGIVGIVVGIIAYSIIAIVGSLVQGG